MMDKAATELSSFLNASFTEQAQINIRHYYHDAIRHGVALVIHETLTRNKPLQVKSPWEQYYLEQMLSSQLQLKAVHQLFEDLGRHNIAFTTLKGWALASTLYNNIATRPKTDIDILVNSTQRETIIGLFHAQGFSNPRGWQPKFISDQVSMRKKLSGSVCLNVDIHFELTNDKRIQRLFPPCKILQNAQYNNILRGPVINMQDAFCHAVIHLLHHKANGDCVKLIWIYDLYQLLLNMQDAEILEVTRKVERIGLGYVFKYVATTLNTHFPSAQCAFLLKELAGVTENKSFSYLLRPYCASSMLQKQLTDAENMADKIGVIREGLFPPSAEIKNKYGQSNWPILLLYVRRIISGVTKRLF